MMGGKASGKCIACALVLGALASVLRAGTVKDAPTTSAGSLEEQTSSVGYLQHEIGRCTGTLVTPDRVLTAAHCVTGRTASSIVFSLSPIASQDAKRATASAVHIHPGYFKGRDDVRRSDVAVLSLASRDYGAAQDTFFELHESPAIPRQSAAVVVGYGFDRDGLRGERKVKRVLANSLFLSPVRFAGTAFFQIRPGLDGETPCEGDSGGPILKFIDGKLRLLGVMSSMIAETKYIERADKAPFAAAGRFLCRRAEASFATSVADVMEWLKPLLTAGTAAVETRARVPASSELSPLSLRRRSR